MRSATLTFLILSFVIINSFSQNPELLDPAQILGRANELYDSAKYHEAIALLKSIPDRDTAYAVTHSLLAKCHMGLEEYDQVIAVCEKQLVGPTEERVNFLLLRAQATERKGDYRGAITLLEEALAQYPLDVDLLFNTGLFQFNHKEYEPAEKNFFKVITISPFYASAHANLAKIAMGQGRKVRAMLAMGMYLGIRVNDNQTLVLIDKFLDNQVPEEGSFPQFGNNGPANLDRAIRARIVKEKGYKTRFSATAPVIQQYELMLDQLETIPTSGDDPYVNYYLPIYREIKNQNLIEAFIYHILTSSSIEASAKWRAKNDKELKRFFSVANQGLTAHRVKLTNLFGYDNPVSAWYDDDNKLGAIGNVQGDNRTGRWVFYYNNSEKSAEGDYKDGSKTGTWKYYYRNGLLKSDENYETGEVTLRWHNGVPVEHFFLKNDEIEGDVELFYDEGPVREKVTFQNGERHGPAVTFFGDGTVRTKTSYSEGYYDGDYVLNFETGALKERGGYKAGDLHGKLEAFHINGKQSVTGEYMDGNQVGTWKYFYPNGQLRRTGSYTTNGNPVGEWVYYDTRGVLTEKRNFDEEGRFHGDISYYENGKLFSKATYDEDRLIQLNYYDESGRLLSSSGDTKGSFHAQQYFPTGQLRAEGDYEDGLFSGTWKFYNRYGVQVSEYSYQADRLNGPAREFFPSGELKIECSYENGKFHGFYKEYFRNGKLKQQGWYQHGSREQQWLSYYPDGTLESDYYYIDNSTVGKEKSFAIDGKLFSEIEIDRNGRIANLVYFDRESRESTVKRKENAVDVYEEFFANKKVESRHNILCGSYTGTLGRFYPDGSVHYSYEFVNGKRNGKYMYRELDGTLVSEGVYADGNQEGVWKYYHDNGHLHRSGKYLEGERDSLWNYFFYNGVRSSEIWFRNDERHGVNNYFAPDGTHVVSKRFENGDLVAFRALYAPDTSWVKFKGNETITGYYPNGKKAFEEQYKNGLLHGFDRLYYPDGSLFSEFLYDGNDLMGEYRELYPGNKLMEKGTFVYGEANGVTEQYDEQGRIRSRVELRGGYRHGKSVIYKNGVKQKEVMFWHGTVVQ